MATIPILRSVAPAPSIGGIAIRPVEVPDLHTGEGLTAGLHELGQAGLEFAVQQKQAQDETRAATATTDYLTKLDAAETTAVRSRDYQTAPQSFAGTAAGLEQEAIAAANLDPAKSAQLQLQLRQHTIAANGRVQTSALGQQVDQSSAARLQLETQMLTAASGAQSPVQRQAFVKQFYDRGDADVAAGLVHADQWALQRQRFDQSLSERDVLAGIRTDPAGTKKLLLEDPTSFPGLDPAARQRAINAAETGSDQAAVDKLRFQASGTHPETASLAFGQVLSPSHGEAIFQHGILPNEGGVDKSGAGITSPKGALGLAQTIPSTARLMATKLGLSDVAGLSDAQLKTYLNDPAHRDVSYQLGLAYWNEQLKTFDGNIALAAAAYNAGPGRAAAWQQQAVAQYGPNPTPAQIASVINLPETKAYVLKLFGHMGVPPTGPGLSQGNLWQGYAATTEILRANESRRNQAIDRVASYDRAITGDMVDHIKAGEAADSRLADALQANQAAADGGSSEAAGWVHTVQTAFAAKPYIDQAYAMPPPRLSSEVAGLGAAAATRPLTEAERLKLDSYQMVLGKIDTGKNTDPVALGVRAGNFPEVALDPAAAPADPAFRQALADRGRQAENAALTYGGATLPFHPAEVGPLKARFAGAPVGEKLALLTAMAGSMAPPAYHAAIAQLGLEPATEAAGVFTPTRPALAQKILVGEELLKVPGADKAGNALETDLANQVADLYPPGSPALAGVVTAARAVYAANRGAKAALFDKTDSATMDTALQEVTGPLTKVGGIKVAAPATLTTSEFHGLWNGLTETDVAQFGGAVDGSGRPVDVAHLREHAILRQRTPGGSEYYVGMPDASASDGVALYHRQDGKPLVVDFARLGLKSGAVTRTGAPPPIGPTKSQMMGQPVIGLGTPYVAPVGP